MYDLILDTLAAPLQHGKHTAHAHGTGTAQEQHMLVNHTDATSASASVSFRICCPSAILIPLYLAG